MWPDDFYQIALTMRRHGSRMDPLDYGKYSSLLHFSRNPMECRSPSCASHSQDAPTPFSTAPFSFPFPGAHKSEFSSRIGPKRILSTAVLMLSCPALRTTPPNH